MNPKNPALEIRELKKFYGNFQALAGLSFFIEPGEIFSLLGPNGAGKTTLISTITTLIEPSSGEVLVFGKNPQTHPRKVKKEIGYVPQELIHYGFFNVEEILRYHAYYFGISNPFDRMEFLLKELDLWTHRKKLVQQLSGGMKRRLLIAKALLHEPKLLLLDEPTAGVDIELRQSLWKFLDHLRKKEQIAILLTTHYLEEAEMLADRIGILKEGALKKVAPTKQLLSDLTFRHLILQTKEPKQTFDHPHLITQKATSLIFKVPKETSLGSLLSSLQIPMEEIEDFHIREGNLEDAFQEVLADHG